MLTLEVRRRDEAGSTLFQSRKTPVFVGRDRAMDLVLDDPLISRQHAVIVARAGRFVLQDIGGRNPIRVNEVERVSHALEPGDVISIGDTDLVVAATDEDAARASDSVGPTVVDARETIARFRRTGTLDGRNADDTDAPGGARPSRAAGRSERDLRSLRQFGELIHSLADRQRVLEAALDIVFEHLSVIRCFVGDFVAGDQLVIRAERSLQPDSGSRRRDYSQTIVERVRRDAVSILFNPSADSSDESLGGEEARGPDSGRVEPKDTASRGIESKSIVRLKINSAMCLPLFRADDVTGVLYLDSREGMSSFDQQDLHFASVLSHFISLALEKEELYERIQAENLELKSILHQKNRMIAVGPSAKEVLRRIKRVAQFDTTVLVTGESGTGKELVARGIHDRSPRRAHPFVAVNCAAIPETLLESELFGYAPKSGISGSNPQGKPGKFELAHGGTLFLDEIGDMTLSTQAKILRVLEDRVVDRLGSEQGVEVDLRIVAATNRQLQKAVEEGRFREDLYYRLKVFDVHLPPLRERRDDILPLCQHFLSLHPPEGRPPAELSPRAKELVLAYPWPGNIRELKNCIEQALLLSNGRTIYPENLPSDLRRGDHPQEFASLAELEAQYIAQVLQSVNWNKRRAAQVLGINRSTLYEKIKVYELTPPAADAGLASGAAGNGAETRS